MSLFPRYQALPAVNNRVAAVIKVGSAYVMWAQRVAKKDGGKPPTKEELNRDCLTILLPHFDNPDEAVAWLRVQYAPVIMMEMLSGWTKDSKQWPNPDSMVWEEWFRVEVHSMLFDGGGSVLKVDATDDLVGQWKQWIEGR